MSTQNRFVPSFFGKITIGDAQGEFPQHASRLKIVPKKELCRVSV